MSIIADVAKGLATHLAALPALASADVRFRHLEEMDIGSLDALTVVVTPRGADILAAARRAGTYDYRVGLFVAARVADETEAESAMEATEAIMEAIHLDDWGDPNDRIAFSSMIVALNQDESMSEANLFRATLEVTYKVLRGP